METLMVKVKSGRAARLLADFLKTIDYVEAVDAAVTPESAGGDTAFTAGQFEGHEKPSDFAGIWKKRKKTDAKKLRERAWRRKK